MLLIALAVFGVLAAIVTGIVLFAVGLSRPKQPPAAVWTGPCDRCGVAIAPGQSFCGACGAPVQRGKVS